MLTHREQMGSLIERREHDIENLLQEALEEEGAVDKKLNQLVIALGLLLESLNSAPNT